MRLLARVPLATAARAAGRARMHTLHVPYVHHAVTPFEHGVPTSQVRSFGPQETAWDFWTSSEAFQTTMPRIKKGLTHIPYGEAWVIERFGSFSHVADAGVHFLIPGMHRVRAVKNAHTVVMGVVAAQAKSKDGRAVDAYAVVHVRVVDPYQSAYYEDPETGRADSERALARVVRETLAKEVAKTALSASASCGVSEAEAAAVRGAVFAAARAEESAFGLEIADVEFRGVFAADAEVPAKLRALEAPVNDPNVPGHAMSADYWGDVLTPPFFKKFKFGSLKEYETKTGTSLDWVIPSPPEYHHFNQLPRYCIDVAEAKERGLLSDAGSPSAGKISAAH